MPNSSANGLFDTPDDDDDDLKDESFPPLPPPLSPGEGIFEDPLDTGGLWMLCVSEELSIAVLNSLHVSRIQVKQEICPNYPTSQLPKEEL